MKQFLKRCKRFGLTLAAVIAILMIVLGSSSCSSSVYSGPVESITVAYSPYVETAFYWVAEDQHFFSQNGLAVTFSKYDALVPAVDDLLKGKVDIVGNVTEFPVVNRTLQKARISAIGSIAKSDTISLIGRRDRGIGRVSDLKGKRVGTLHGTITDFYLGRLLELDGMNVRDVTLVDVKTAANSVNAVVNGEVDAVVVGQPYANSARDQLGANAFLQSAQSSQPLYALAVSTDEWINNHPELVIRLLKSLAQAESFVVLHPGDAKVIVEKNLGLDQPFTDSVWPQYKFSLSLDQSLILAMEDEARWIISNNLTTEKAVPNFLNFIYTDGLKAAEPGALKIAGK